MGCPGTDASGGKKEVPVTPKEKTTPATPKGKSTPVAPKVKKPAEAEKKAAAERAAAEKKAAIDKLFTAAKAGNVSQINEAIEAGVDANALDNRGWTALRWASHRGQTATVKALIDKGADVEERYRGAYAVNGGSRTRPQGYG